MSSSWPFPTTWFSSSTTKGQRTTREIMVSSIIGGTTFWMCTLITQGIGGFILRIAAHSILASWLGGIAIGCSSIISLWTSEITTRKFLQGDYMITVDYIEKSWKELNMLTKQMFQSIIPSWLFSIQT